MNNFKISTTAFEEEDFNITTTLSYDEVVDSIKPIVMAERKGLSIYDNLDLINKLHKDYPTAVIVIGFNNQTIKI